VSPAPAPREALGRCALEAEQRGDPMLGTAFPASRVLLVEQPGSWGRSGLRDSAFDRATAATLEARAGRVGMRVRAIRAPGRSVAGSARRWAIADCRPGREAISWGSFERDDELLDLALDGSAGTPSDRAAYLVCAHSKHDICCAVRGRPVAAALHAERPGEVWECSHVGGERFAANVLVLPHGLLYGRVLAISAPEFIGAAERGEVIGALLRGRVGLPPLDQAALAFAYDHLALRHVDDLRVTRTGAVRDGIGVVELAGPHGRLEVTVRAERVAATGLTCGNPGPNAYLAYRPVSVTAVS
jgi:hypothetical protein